nr:MAG TPA: hypothetical protein [Caudoviricetes sp.]
MDAVKFIEERNRMCKSFGKYCYGCPAWDGSCKLEPGTYRKCEADKVVKIVEEWSAAQPRKTRQDVFLEHCPDANLDRHGISSLCPKLLNYNFSCIDENDTETPKRYKDCSVCRCEFWMQEVE